MTPPSTRPPPARFLKSVPRWRPAEDDGRAQVAVGGRSNVGKSSLINRVLGRKALARTSNTPGRTQALNYFEVGDDRLLVDLPGHGYAKAPLAVVRQWQQNTRRYLLESADLVGVALLLDVRREPTADDRELLALARQGGREVLVVVTKIDKVGRGERARRVQALARTLGCDPKQLLVSSARTGEGAQAVWRALAEWLAGPPAEETPDPEERQMLRVVAIDGPSGAGKSTVARALAGRLGWSYIDTGAMYRSVGLKADRLGVPLDDDPALERLCSATRIDLLPDPAGGVRVLLDDEDVSEAIREHRVSDLASRVSARQPVRAAMGRYQRQLGERRPAVLEGRDIGTVVFPDAAVKIYLTAAPEERARRRTEELCRRGQPADPVAVLADIRARDHQDSTRRHAPLVAAADAVEVDTTGLGIEAVVERLAAIVARTLGGAENG